MKTEDYLKILVEEIHSTVVATIVDVDHRRIEHIARGLRRVIRIADQHIPFPDTIVKPFTVIRRDVRPAP